MCKRRHILIAVLSLKMNTSSPQQSVPGSRTGVVVNQKRDHELHNQSKRKTCFQTYRPVSTGVSQASAALDCGFCATAS